MIYCFAATCTCDLPAERAWVELYLPHRGIMKFCNLQCLQEYLDA